MSDISVEAEAEPSQAVAAGAQVELEEGDEHEGQSQEAQTDAEEAHNTHEGDLQARDGRETGQYDDDVVYDVDLSDSGGEDGEGGTSLSLEVQVDSDVSLKDSGGAPTRDDTSLDAKSKVIVVPCLAKPAAIALLRSCLLHIALLLVWSRKPQTILPFSGS